MTPELLLLAWSIVLGMIHLGATALAKRAQEPPLWNVGSRDAGEPAYKGLAARLIRAQSNFMETFPFFAAAILVAHVAGKEGPAMLWGAGLYLGGRVVYLPLYAAGVPYMRTAAWLVATAGLVSLTVRCLLP